jgi:multidrug resistance efflux pump
MAAGDDARYVRAEVETLRREVAEMRGELKELARAVDELHRTFRSLAVHLGIAAEPYRRRDDPAGSRDLPGFA